MSIEAIKLIIPAAFLCSVINDFGWYLLMHCSVVNLWEGLWRGATVLRTLDVTLLYLRVRTF